MIKEVPVVTGLGLFCAGLIIAVPLILFDAGRYFGRYYLNLKAHGYLTTAEIVPIEER